MPTSTATDADTRIPDHGSDAPPTADAVEQTPVVEEESLVEEISIDGMCGVY